MLVVVLVMVVEYLPNSGHERLRVFAAISSSNLHHWISHAVAFQVLSFSTFLVKDMIISLTLPFF